MIVFSREVGMSLIIRPADATIQLTVVKIFRDKSSASILVRQATASGSFEKHVIHPLLQHAIELGPSIALTLLDVPDSKIRIAIVAPRNVFVSRLELCPELGLEDDLA